MKKLVRLYCKIPILLTLALSIFAALVISTSIELYDIICWNNSYRNPFQDIVSHATFFLFTTLPVILTIENIVFLIIKPMVKSKNITNIKIELFGAILGVLFSWGYVSNLTDIEFADWSVQLYNSQVHTPIAKTAILTIIFLATLAFWGYLYLQFVPLRKQPPLTTVIGIATLYLGSALCILWCIQLGFSTQYLWLWVFPLNCVIITAKTIRGLVLQKLERDSARERPAKLVWLSALFNDASNWPWLALIAALPVLGIVAAVLTLFGQEPDSILKAWTHTADWTFSQKAAPPNIMMDEHYLCTVAAGGHKKVVKPIRTGNRHGHTVLVNRQLCVANAFEQLLQERAPSLHRVIRKAYDKTGYPIAKHIRSPYLADCIYFFMKPLEWIFVAVLYLFDAKPENRIAVQYPHSEAPIG